MGQLCRVIGCLDDKKALTKSVSGVRARGGGGMGPSGSSYRAYQLVAVRGATLCTP